MGVAAVLIVLAIVFFGIGFLAKGLLWAVIIGGVLLIAGVVTGMRGRRRLP